MNIPPVWEPEKGNAKDESETDWASKFTLNNSAKTKDDILLNIIFINFYS